IWGFGTVLFEMLTGRQAFQGDDVSDTLAEVLKGEPDWLALPDATPELIRRLLRRCLEKDRKERLQDIGDARIEIHEVLRSSGTATGAALPSVGPACWRGTLSWVIGAAVGGLLIGFTVWGLMRSKPPMPREINRFSIMLPSTQQFTRYGRHAVAISPNGTHLAYTANDQLYVRPMDQLVATPLPGITDPSELVFSPDGQWIAYFENADNNLKKVAIRGGHTGRSFPGCAGSTQRPVRIRQGPSRSTQNRVGFPPVSTASGMRRPLRSNSLFRGGWPQNI
ncbi:MAG: hypothetical protein ABIG68_08360, partial [Acidobacteriota bacterium]